MHSAKFVLIFFDVMINANTAHVNISFMNDIYVNCMQINYSRTLPHSMDILNPQHIKMQLIIIKFLLICANPLTSLAADIPNMNFLFVFIYNIKFIKIIF